MFIFLWVWSPCKKLESYDTPLCQFSNGGNKKKNKKKRKEKNTKNSGLRHISTKPSAQRRSDQHIFNCQLFKEENEESEEYENIFNGSLKQKIEIFETFQNKMKIRELKIKEKQTDEINTPCDPSDPLFFVGLVMD